MLVTTAPTVRAETTDETLGALLSPTHDVWIEDARQLLLPAATPGAAFLERWSAVRWLDERFLERFNAERAIMAELRPFIPVRGMDMLEAEAQRIARLHLALGGVDCRRRTAAEFARLATELLEALELWCARIEISAARVRPETLSREGRRILGQLTAPLKMYWRASA